MQQCCKYRHVNGVGNIRWVYFATKLHSVCWRERGQVCIEPFSGYLCGSMRSVLIYILTLAVLLPSISSWGIIAHYQLNKEYIARVLCENRDKPQMHCDGKCYLAKRLKAQQDKQDKETAERVQHSSLIQLYYESYQAFTFAPPVAPAHHQVFTYLLSVYAAPTHGLLRPPCA